MVAQIFQTIGDAITAFATNLASAMTSVVSIFWVTEGTNQGPTFLGTLLLVAIGVGVVYLAYRLIKGAVKGVAR